VAPSIQN